jgi:hypothetical protein
MNRLLLRGTTNPCGIAKGYIPKKKFASTYAFSKQMSLKSAHFDLFLFICVSAFSSIQWHFSAGNTKSDLNPHSKNDGILPGCRSTADNRWVVPTAHIPVYYA